MLLVIFAEALSLYGLIVGLNAHRSTMQERMDYMERALGVSANEAAQETSANKAAQAEFQRKASKLQRSRYSSKFYQARAIKHEPR